MSYSIQTIEKLKAVAGDEARVYSLIGADAFAEIRMWHRWSDVVREMTFIVVTRPGRLYSTPPGSTVFRLGTLALPVSSSDIRARVAAGERPVELPATVMDYKKHALYGLPGGPIA